MSDGNKRSEGPTNKLGWVQLSEVAERLLAGLHTTSADLSAGRRDTNTPRLSCDGPLARDGDGPDPAHRFGDKNCREPIDNHAAKKRTAVVWDK